jgi:RimJ/RimL family protein N-acetyltransferase
MATESTTTLFETARLAARRLSKADAAAMVVIYGDLETMRFVGDGQPLSEESCLYWVDVTDANFERRGYGMIAFVDRTTGEIVGCGGVVHPAQQEEPEVKYAFRRDQWGRGYATEAVCGLVAFARDSLKLNSLMATVYPGNLRSQRVLHKSGFHHERDRPNEDGPVTQIWTCSVSEFR